MIEHPTTKLVLASASPRRKDLLTQIGITPTAIVSADIDETPHKNESARAYARRMAAKKASVVAPNHVGKYILAADTVVAAGRRILGKPCDADQARAFLQILSGRRHHIYGGIAVIIPPSSQSKEDKIITRVVDTMVQFKALNDKQITAYLDTGQWQGVAGGYAVQGRAAQFVKRIDGSYSNIVGLSLYDTMAILDGNGFQV